MCILGTGPGPIMAAAKSCEDEVRVDTLVSCENEAEEQQPLNAGHFHEIIDRGHLICSMIDDFLIDHPGMTKQMNQLCEEAQQKLCTVTNLACAEDDRIFGN